MPGAISALASVERADLRKEGENLARALASEENLPHLVPFVHVLLSIGDEQRAYGALRETTRLLFDVSAAASDSRWPYVMAAMAEMLLEYLEQRPSEPLLLNSLGVSLYELNDIRVAELLFKKALALAPDTPEAENNLEGVKRRRRYPVQAQLPPIVNAKLRELSKRAERVVSQAKPTQGQTISFCMIVKNEEQDLPACLESVKDVVDQMIVVDTGSTDRTVEIAKSFGAQVIDFPWTGSFSDARNVSLEAATGDWIFYLDADERLVEDDKERLKALVSQTWREGFYLHETNFTGTEDSGGAQPHMAFRLFKNRPWYRFEGAIHEQKMWSFPSELTERFLTTDVRILHYGYLKDRRVGKDKINRNITLLEKELAENPSTFTHFNLGSEYSWLGEYGKAREQYEKSLELLRQFANWRDTKVFQFSPMLIVRLAEAIRMTDRQAVYPFIEQALEWFPNHTDLVFERAIAEYDDRNYDQAEATLSKCLELGDAPVEWGPISGRGTFLALRFLGQIYQKRGDDEKAIEVLTRSAGEYPSFSPVFLELSKLLLARRGASAADAELTRLGAEGSASAAMWVASAFYEEFDNLRAEKWYRAALKRSPQHPPSILGLGETLMALGRYEEAVEVLSGFNEEHLLIGAALRSRCFCLLCLDRCDEAKQLLPLYAENEPAEAPVYEAWIKRAAGQDAELEPRNAAFLERILDVLVKLREFVRFELVLPLLDSAVPDRRARARMLASLFERHNFDELAMRQWRSLYDPESLEPDVLYGIGRAATNLGFLEEAETFLSATAAIDPDHRQAQRLLEAIRSRS